MSDPVIGQVIWVAFNFAPRAYAECAGQLLGINQNSALYSLIGTTYGGDGRTTFALPDLRGRVPLAFQGSSYWLGAKGGLEQVTLISQEIPSHTHNLHAASAPAEFPLPNEDRYLAATGSNLYGPLTGAVALASQSVSLVGGNQSHNNMQPTLAMVAAIAMYGLFPPQN